jgi:hypothetical protein
MGLSFRPNCATLARGLLPHQQMQAATQLLLALTPEIVSLPRLLRRTGTDSELRQSMAGFPGLIEGPGDALYVNREVAEAELDRIALAFLRNDGLANPPAVEQQLQLGDFSRALVAGPRPKAIVVECYGPVSSALMLTDEQERPLLYIPELRETVVQHLALRLSWYAMQLQALTNEVIVCLYEPMLDALGSPFSPLERDEGLALLDQVLRSVPQPRGLVLSGAARWEGLLGLPLDLIVCDAYDHQAALVEAASAVQLFLEQGGKLGLGVVPSDPALLEDESVNDCVARVQQLVGALVERGIAAEQLAAAMLITTSDGLALASPGMAEQALQLCAYTTEQLRAIYL